MKKMKNTYNMKFIRKYNESESSDDIFKRKDHLFLKSDFITDCFFDLIELGYSLGFKGQYSPPV